MNKKFLLSILLVIAHSATLQSVDRSNLLKGAAFVAGASWIGNRLLNLTPEQKQQEQTEAVTPRSNNESNFARRHFYATHGLNGVIAGLAHVAVIVPFVDEKLVKPFLTAQVLAAAGNWAVSRLNDRNTSYSRVADFTSIVCALLVHGPKTFNALYTKNTQV